MHVFSQRVIDYLIQPHHSEVEQAKITFGVRMLFSDLYKFFAVYGTALLLGCLLEVLVMHLTFYFLRQVGLGYHFVSELQCVLWSIVLFPVFCAILLVIRFEGDIFLLVISSLIFVILAPVGTKKFTVVNPMHRRYLRKKSWIRLAIVLGVYFFSPTNLQPFIVLGIGVEVLMMLMQVYLNVKERNV